MMADCLIKNARLPKTSACRVTRLAFALLAATVLFTHAAFAAKPPPPQPSSGTLVLNYPAAVSWGLAASASGSPSLRRLVETWREPLESGSTPAELVTASRAFPDLFSNLYHTAELSGKLDETLRRLHTIYQENGSMKMRLVSQWTPKMLFGCIALIVAWKVVGFYSSYFDQVKAVMQ